MKVLLLLTLLLSSCVIHQAKYLINKRKDGKEFWGRNYVVKEGDDLTMPCHSKPKYGRQSLRDFLWQVLPRKIGKIWYNTTNLVSQYLMRKPFVILKRQPSGIKATLLPNTRKLVIRNITQHAAATYRCIVVSTTEKGKTYVEVTYNKVEVQAPPKIDSTTKSPISLSAGDILVIDCTSSGNPTPNILWTRKGHQLIVNERTFQHTNGLLTITNVGQTDGGIYTCHSNNSFGSDFRTFVVDVKVPAKVLTKVISYATIGEDAEVKCEAIGNPKPTFFWKWHKTEGEIISLNEITTRTRFKVETIHRFESSVSFLKIKNVQQSDFREYKCFAKNTEGYSHLQMQLVKYSVPERPKIFGILPRGVNLDLFWSYGNDGGKKIDSVIIEYAPWNGKKWQNITIENPLTQKYTIKNLRRQTEYKLRMLVTNEIGKSALTALYIMQTDTLSKPKSLKIKKILPHDDHIDITWSYAADNYGKTITSVIIEYAKANSKTWQRITIKKLHTTSYSIRNICTQTDYKIRLFVKNEFGKSAPTKTQYIKTDTKPGPLTPRVAVGITWNYKNNKIKIKLAIIQYASINSSEWKNVTIRSSQTTCHAIRNLRPMTNYRFRMFATDEMKEILTSAVHHIKTDVSERPEGLIKISWKRKLPLVKIQYAPVHSNQWENLTVNNATHYIIRNLYPLKFFKLRIFFRNENKTLTTKRFYRRAVVAVNNPCNILTVNSSNHQVNISLSYQRSINSVHTPSKPHQTKSFLDSLHMKLIIAGTLFIIILFVTVWSLRKKRKKCSADIQHGIRDTINTATEDKETVL